MAFAKLIITATLFAIVLSIVALLMPHRSGTALVQIILTIVFPPMFFTFFTRALTSWERFGRISDSWRVGSGPLNLWKRSPEGEAPIGVLMIIAIVSFS